MTFVFSYNVAVPTAVLKRRPWWNIFGRDQLVYEDRWQRRDLHGLSQEQADYLRGMTDNIVVSELLLNLLARPGEKLSDVQLEAEVSALPAYYDPWKHLEPDPLSIKKTLDQMR